MFKRFWPRQPDEAPPQGHLPWGLMAMFMGGVAVVLLGGYIGDQADLRGTLYLDLFGESDEGVAERQEDGAYRIQYSHPTGAIYARSGFSSLGLQSISGDVGSVRVQYAKEQPGRFQPRSISYLPAMAAGGLFVLGMGLVVFAHRRFRRMAAQLP